MIESNFLEVLCQKIGWSATLALVINYAEQRVYVPLQFDPDHHLAHTLGERGFKALVAAHGEDTISVPACSDANRIGMTKSASRLKRAGFENRNIALFLGVSERQVRNLVSDSAPLGQKEHVQHIHKVWRSVLFDGLK